MRNPCRRSEVSINLPCLYLTKSNSERMNTGNHPRTSRRPEREIARNFSLWTWREFLAMGYDARFVAGRHGRYGIGHAWVTFKKDGKRYLVEPQLRFVGETFPRLSTLRYQPKFSVAWDGEKVSFYSHGPSKMELSPRVLIPLIPEWIWGWSRFLLWAAPRIHTHSGDRLCARRDATLLGQRHREGCRSRSESCAGRVRAPPYVGRGDCETP